MKRRRFLPPAKPVSEAQQSFMFTRRAMVLGGAQAALGGILALRMGYLAVVENEHYETLAESNRVNLTLIPPRRGWIVDRHGKPMAINRTDFRVDIIPDRLKQPEETLRKLAALLDLPPEEITRIEQEIEEAAGYQPVPVAENLEWEKYAAVSVRMAELPGVAPARGFSRFYPEGAAVGHLVGFVGAASAEEYEESKDPLLITPGFKVGKEGLEETMEKRLRGLPGAKRVEVTARGKLVRELTTRPDTPGKPLPLTIDAGLQLYAARRLGNESGSVVVIDTHNGDILALASMPAYDPNSFSDGIAHDEWDMLAADERKPLLNKVLKSLYPPGSTLKPMASLAIQQAGVDPEETVFCGGGYRLGNRFFRCLGRHGSVNMHRAIAKSCNSYFYAMAHRLGYDRIAHTAKMLGLGREFELPFASQRYGTIPDSTWKLKKYNQKWSHSDSLNAVIGQGYVIVNPLQLAVMSARIASGRMLEPRLLASMPPKPAPRLPFTPEQLAVTRAGMWEVVNGDGTAGRSRLPLEGIEMAGKTGTAQVRRIASGQRGQSGDWKYRDHGLFVCFAPTDNPRYAASVVIEHGLGGSRAAAPVASDVLTYLFDPVKAMEKLQALEESWGGDIPTRMAAQAEAWKAAKLARAAAPGKQEAAGG